ncbi:MAG: DUF1592 domain-containing protein [Pedosphaera sp.]|nr:DUF1592 domain-containing protein [Pedosphaera sp.]
MRMRKQLVILSLLLTGTLVSARLAWVRTHPSRRVGMDLKAAALAFEKQVLPVLNQYCWDCHGDGMKKGDLTLDAYTNAAAVLANRKTWEHVLLNLRNGEMPPQKKPQPSPAQRELLVDWIEKTLFPMDPNHPDPGRVTVRRLNRTEYNNTIRDLVGVDFKPAEDFPQDDVGYGFDNIGDVLSLPPLLLEKYLRAAQKVMDAAIVTGPLPPEVRSFGTDEFEGGERRPDGRKLDYEGEFTLTTTNRQSGDHVLRITAGASPGTKEAVRMAVGVNDEPSKIFEVKASRENQKTFEYPLTRSRGEQRVKIAMIKATEPIPQVKGKKVERKLVVSKISWAGPPNTEWPLLPASHRDIFFRKPANGNETAVAKEILERFTSRAFRRPATRGEVDRLLGLYKQARENQENFESGIKLACNAVLVSPHFLFRGELQPEPDNPLSVHRVGEYALASRLSYFLWSTMPDSELTNLAKQGRLRSNLASQVSRMLSHPKSSALVDNFASQWLNLRLLDIAAPDRKKFPSYDNRLRDAMREETERFLRHVVQANRPVTELIDADYTFVNQSLAEHYGIKGVTGNDFVRVSLKNTPRGGLLTHGSLLTLTSNPTRTSPVKRGKYVLDNLLGTPPLPPPPNVPELKAGEELTGTLRQKMEQHRDNVLCASCHARMDPIGFAFENFDAIGRWRDLDGKDPIDPAGVLVSGEKFAGPEGLKRILAGSRRADFLHCVTEKLLTYSLGRGLEYYDQPAVKKILARMEKQGVTFASLAQSIVESVPFQYRRGDGDPNRPATSQTN